MAGRVLADRGYNVVPSMTNIVMQAARRRSIQANLFPAALESVEPWDKFHWHGAAGETCDAYIEKSSQALAIDLFVSLKLHPRCDAVFERLAGLLGVAAGGPWVVTLEWHDPANTLAEKQPTWVDAVARGARSLIFFECKFCEADGGACSQTRPIAAGRRKGLVQCNGHYLPQTNPANGRHANCALAAKGIRYWDLIPEIFGYAADASYAPCPFAGAWFHRCLVSMDAQSGDVRCGGAAGRPPAGLRRGLGRLAWLTYGRADSQGRVALARIAGPPSVVSFRTLSFQSMAELACQALPADPVWLELAAWIQRKISSVGGVNLNLLWD